MATEIEKLVVQLSADFKSFEKALARQQGVANKQFNAIERRALQMNKNLDGIFSRSFNGLKAGVAGVGAALGVNELRKLTDTWTDLTSRVNLAVGSQEKGVEVMDRLGTMARRTYSDLALTTESYLANSTALQELGYSTDQSLDYTEALNNALVVSGAKGDKAARVQDALAKAMGLGKLQGQNLNTVLADGDRVVKALAAGLGTTVGGLRKLGAEGKITGRVMVDALSSQMEKLRKEADAMPATIGDGFTLLNNALLEYVGNADSATGISAKVADALIVIADNFDKVADAGLQVAAVLAGVLVGRSLAQMIRTLGLAGVALTNFTKALAAARTMGGLATAMGGLSAAAGPVGMIIGGAVVSSLLLYNSAIGKSSEGSEVYAAALKKVKEAAEEAADGVDAAAEKIARGAPEKISEGITHSLEEINSATQEVIRQFDNLRNVSFEGVPQEEVDKVQELGRQFKAGKITADELAAALDGITRANPVWENFTSSIEGFIGKLNEAVKASRLLKAELADTKTAGGRSAKDDAVKVDINAIAAETYEKEALRRAALGKSQLSLENEIAKVRNDALKEGITLTEKQIETIAKANVAGDAARSAEGKKPKKEKAPAKTEDDYFFQITQQVKDRTAALAEEAKITGLTFVEQEKRRTALELEQDVLSRLREEARKKGDKDWENIKLTPEQVSSIDAVSEAYARQADELRKIQDAQYDAERAAAEFADTIKSGFVDAVTGANSLQDALAGILKKLAEMILNSAFDKLFNGASASGGWLTGVMKTIGFADGGYTGSGGVNQPAGVVHKGEVVWSQKDVARAGGVAAVEAMRRGMRGYSAGGAVAMPALKAPTMPVLKAQPAGGGSVSAPVSIQIDARGADSEGLARVQQQMAQMQRELPSVVVKTVREAQNKNIKLG